MELAIVEVAPDVVEEAAVVKSKYRPVDWSGDLLLTLHVMTTETAWKQYADGLLDYFKSKVNDHAIAEDLRQEVFLKLHTHRTSLNDSDKIQHWLRAVAHNVLVDHWKGQHKQREVELPPQKEESQKALDHLAEHCVSHLLSTMSKEYANAVRWSDLEGQKQSDIADKLNLSLSGAKRGFNVVEICSSKPS